MNELISRDEMIIKPTRDKIKHVTNTFSTMKNYNKYCNIILNSLK